MPALASVVRVVRPLLLAVAALAAGQPACAAATTTTATHVLLAHAPGLPSSVLARAVAAVLSSAPARNASSSWHLTVLAPGVPPLREFAYGVEAWTDNSGWRDARMTSSNAWATLTARRAVTAAVQDAVGMSARRHVLATRPRVVFGASRDTLGAMVAAHAVATVQGNATAPRNRILLVASHVAVGDTTLATLKLGRGVDAACAPVTTPAGGEVVHSHLAFAPHPSSDFDPRPSGDSVGHHAPFDALEGYPTHAAHATYTSPDGRSDVPSCAGALVLLRPSAVARLAVQLAAYRGADAIAAHVCLSARTNARRCVMMLRAAGFSLDDIDGAAGLALALNRADVGVGEARGVGGSRHFPADLAMLHRHFGTAMERFALGADATAEHVDRTDARTRAGVHYSLECGTGQMLGLTLEAVAFLRALEEATSEEHARHVRIARAHANATVQALGAMRRRLTASALVLSDRGADIGACLRDLVAIAPAADVRMLRRLTSLSVDMRSHGPAACVLHHDPGRYQAAKQRLPLRLASPPSPPPPPPTPISAPSAWSGSWRSLDASAGFGSLTLDDTNLGDDDDDFLSWREKFRDFDDDVVKDEDEYGIDEEAIPDVAPLRMPPHASSFDALADAWDDGVGSLSDDTGSLSFSSEPELSVEGSLLADSPRFTPLPGADDEPQEAADHEPFWDRPSKLDSFPADYAPPPATSLPSIQLPPPPQDPSSYPSVRLDHDLTSRFSGLLGSSDGGGGGPPQSLPQPPRSAVVYIGRSMYETDTVPSHWPAAAAAHVDEIWTPTEHARRAFAIANVTTRRGSTKAHIVPELIDARLFAPDAVVSAMSVSDDANIAVDVESGDVWTDPLSTHAFGTELRLLSVFKWEVRKGWDVLLRSYYDAFFAESRGAVSLHIRSSVDDSNRQALADFDEAYCTSRVGDNASVVAHCIAELLPRVTLLSLALDSGAMTRLYSSVDAFVLSTRGEGWGRPLHEAMAMGIPSVATAWAGTGELMGCALHDHHVGDQGEDRDATPRRDNHTEKYAALLGVPADATVACAMHRGVPVAFPLPYRLVPMNDKPVRPPPPPLPLSSSSSRVLPSPRRRLMDDDVDSTPASSSLWNVVTSKVWWLVRCACRPLRLCAFGGGGGGGGGGMLLTDHQERFGRDEFHTPSHSSRISYASDDASNHMWAEPSATALTQVLKVLRSRPDLRRRVGRAGRRRVTSERYAPFDVAKAMLHRMDHLVDEHMN
ncbi:glycosyl transferase [Pycnococcus provasolii]